MRSISLFAEDFGHEHVVGPLIRRIAAEFDLPIQLHNVSVRGGFGTVQSELKQFVHEVQEYVKPLPDLVVVATDSNCRGIDGRRKDISEAVKPITDRILFAVPVPHIERWLLLDSKAFEQVLNRSCRTPDQKCDRGRYKHALIDEIIAAGRTPLLGGMEYAEEIVQSMKLPQHRPRNELDQFVRDLRTLFKRWKAEA